MNVYSNILDMVGETPMLEITNIDTGKCRLFLKLELMNPGGSIKDRIGISMIEQAEKRGDIKPGDTLVEATAGNTGLGLALVAARNAVGLAQAALKAQKEKNAVELAPLLAQRETLAADGAEVAFAAVVEGSEAAPRNM